VSELYGHPIEIIVTPRGRRVIVGLEEEFAHPHPHPHPHGFEHNEESTQHLSEPTRRPREPERLLSTSFVQHAFYAVTAVALRPAPSGTSSSFVARPSAAHAIGHVGSAAAGAVLWVFRPLVGTVGLLSRGGTAHRRWGASLDESDAVVG